MELFGLELDSRVWVPLAIGVATFIASIIAVGVLLVMLPASYFVHRHAPSESGHPVLRWTLKILKNAVGAVLVVAGVLMLVLPGQGILTILIGVMLLDFPGKWKLQRRLISRPGVLSSINRLRARFGKPPLELEQREPVTSIT
jgi:hypothetical protein